MRAEVYLLDSTREFDEIYTYAYPEDSDFKLFPGCIAEAPFGKKDRKQTVVVRRILPGDSDFIEVKGRKVPLKPLTSVLQDRTPFTEKEMELCEEIMRKYLCTFGSVAKLMMPPEPEKMKKVKMAELAIEDEKAEEIIQGNELRSIESIQILEMLKEDRRLAVNDLVRITGIKTAARINTLAKKGYIRITEDQQENIIEKEYKPYAPRELNGEQQAAFEKIRVGIDSGRFGEILLFGVTSGGKTEVYLKAVEHVLAKNGNAIVLVPEISLTPQMTDRFTGRFGNRVAIIHSRLSEAERKREWFRMKNGEAKVVIGARSAVFAPFEKTDLIILDEEQEWTYKSEETPRYHAAEVARMIGKKDNSTVVYGSATPSVETFYRAEKGKIGLAEIKQRATKYDLPKVELIDMREAKADMVEGLFSQQLYDEMKKNAEEGNQTLLFVQRRGYSRDLVCESCGKTMICRKCGVAMTVHEKAGRLICHYCGNTVKIPKKCPSCGGTDFTGNGFGTERVEQALKKLFPDKRVVRMDSDTTSKKNGHERVISQFRDDHGDFLVGTQMIAKGHDFPGVTLVGVLSADSILNVREYNAPENAFQLITQVCGRAGRGDKPGKVLIQAYDLDSYALGAAVKQNYAEFYNTEIKMRKNLNYPPFCAIGSVMFASENDRNAFDRANEAFDILLAIVTQNGVIMADVLGPARCPMPKLSGKYRWRVTVKAGTEAELTSYFEKFIKQYSKKYGNMTNNNVAEYTEV